MNRGTHSVFSNTYTLRRKLNNTDSNKVLELSPKDAPRRVVFDNFIVTKYIPCNEDCLTSCGALYKDSRLTSCGALSKDCLTSCGALSKDYLTSCGALYKDCLTSCGALYKDYLTSCGALYKDCLTSCGALYKDCLAKRPAAKRNVKNLCVA